MEANNVVSELLDVLHRKMWRRSVEHCHSTEVSARRVLRDGAINTRPENVDDISDLYWNSLKTHVKSLVAVVVYDMYLECAEG